MRVITAAVVMLLVRAASVDAAPTLQLEKSPAPSRVFANIKAGMALADAKAALSAFAWDASYRDAAARRRLVMPTADGAKYYVLVTGETIARIGIEAPEKGLEAKLTRLWGSPTLAKNPANETLTSWSKAAWRVDMACRNTLCRLAFHQRLTPTFFGEAVAPPGVLGALVPGMSREQVTAIAPLHAGGADVPAGFEDVHVKVDVASTGVLRSVVVVGLPVDARELVTQAWGTPTDSDRGPQWIGDRGWRAFYDPELRALELVPHVTVAQLLGNGPGIAALARPLLGAHHDQIVAAYPTFVAKAKGTGTLALPPIESSTRPTTLALAFDKAQRATSLTMVLPYTDRNARGTLLKLLAAKWGVPAARPGNVLTFPTGKIRIQARDLGRGFELSIAIQ